MSARPNSIGHVSYCLFQEGAEAFIELRWAKVKKDVRLISKHRTYEEALDAQRKWYEEFLGEWDVVSNG